jgi:hypothetical protein
MTVGMREKRGRGRFQQRMIALSKKLTFCNMPRVKLVLDVRVGLSHKLPDRRRAVCSDDIHSNSCLKQTVQTPSKPQGLHGW